MDKPPSSLKALLLWGEDCLKRSSPTPRLDAELLLLETLKAQGVSKKDFYLYPEKEISQSCITQFEQNIQRRMQKEPIAFILGHQPFWNLDLKVSTDTLVPRPETECLIEVILQKIQIPSLKVLDLGTGTGAIALSLAKEQPTWAITATDIYPQTLEVARHNATLNTIHNVVFKLGAWFEAVPLERFNVIVSNPPYIAETDEHLIASSISFEPRRALVSPNNGLLDIETIIKQAPHHLETGGLLIIEHGYNQKEAAQYLFKLAGFSQIETRQDLAGLDRLTFGFWQP